MKEGIEPRSAVLEADASPLGQRGSFEETPHRQVVVHVAVSKQMLSILTLTLLHLLSLLRKKKRKGGGWGLTERERIGK